MLIVGVLILNILGDIPDELRVAVQPLPPHVHPLDSFETTRWEEVKVKPLFETPDITIPECDGHSAANPSMGCWNPGEIQVGMCKTIKESAMQGADSVEQAALGICNSTRTAAVEYASGIFDALFDKDCDYTIPRGCGLAKGVLDAAIKTANNLHSQCSKSGSGVQQAAEAVADVGLKACVDLGEPHKETYASHENHMGENFPCIIQENLVGE